MVKNIGRQVFGELLETGKSTAQQAKQISPIKIAKTAAGQLTGSSSSSKPGIKGIREKGARTGSKAEEKIKDMPPTPIGKKKIANLEQRDAFKKERGLSEARSELERIKIQRYQKLQREILTEEKGREEEIPAYEAGKPGGARTLKERAELLAKKREKEEKEKKKAIAQPTSKRPRGMGIFGKVKSKKGTKELGKKMLG